MGQVKILSTPHGALGTQGEVEIRNYYTYLSTPHGALGTGRWVCVIKLPPQAFNSTRCIRNATHIARKALTSNLSTPHGALGTLGEVAIKAVFNKPFNSTRCIRNGKRRHRSVIL